MRNAAFFGHVSWGLGILSLNIVTTARRLLIIKDAITEIMNDPTHTFCFAARRWLLTPFPEACLGVMVLFPYRVAPAGGRTGEFALRVLG